MRPGDLIGFSGGDQVGLAINLFSAGWPFSRPQAWRGLSHVAIVAPLAGHGLVLWESTTLSDCPCLVCGKKLSGVHARWIDDRITEAAGSGAVIWHYPLRNPLVCDLVERLRVFCATFHGLPYDYRGAFDSRATLLACVFRRLFGRDDLSSLFCSEFCGAAHRRLDLWRPKYVSGYSPNSLTRAEIRVGVLGYPGRVYP